VRSAEPERRAVRLLDVPYDHGHKRRGTGLGPAAILRAGAQRALVRGGVPASRSTVECDLGRELPGTEVARTFAVNRALAELVAEALAVGETPVVLAGNCNSCLGTVSGARGQVGSVLWFDGHPDIDTPETSTNGFFGSMALAALTGACWQALCASIPGYRPVPPDQVTLVGTRHLTAVEEEAITAAGISRVEPSALDEAREGGVYLHVDLDVLDPALSPANPWAAADGLTPDELVEAVRRVCTRRQVRAAALTAYDPAVDPEGVVATTAVRVLQELGEGVG
jgi:arginase